MPEDTELRLSVEKSQICTAALCETMWFWFSSSVFQRCGFPCWSLYFPVVGFTKKLILWVGWHKRQTWVSQCWGSRAVFACACFPVNIILPLLYYAADVTHGPPSVSPPWLTKRRAYLPGSYSQAYWHTHCTLSVILDLFPLCHVPLINLFKIFRQMPCRSDWIVVLSKSVYWFP